MSQPITTKEGLLWRNGQVIPLPEADEIAQLCGFQYAEQMVRKLEARQQFVEALAESLTSNIAHKSIQVQMGTEVGKEWAKILNALQFNAYDGKEACVEKIETLLFTMKI